MKVLKKLYNITRVLYNKIPSRVRVLGVCLAVLKYIVLAVILLNNAEVFTSCVSAEQIQNTALPALPVAGSSRSPAPSIPTRSSAFVNWKKLREAHPAWKNFLVLNEEINIINKKIINEKLSVKQKTEAIKAYMPKLSAQKNNFLNDTELKQSSALLQKTTALLASSSINEMILGIDKKFRQQVENQKRELESAFKAFVHELEEESNKRIQTKQQTLEDELFETVRTKEQEFKREFLEYQEAILKQNQNEKLNLQLQLIVAKSPEERNKLETRLSYLIGDEELLMQDKLQEQASLLDSLKNDRNSKISELIKEFSREILKEKQSRLYKRKQELREAFAGFLKSNTSLSMTTISAFKNSLFLDLKSQSLKKKTQQTIKNNSNLEKINESARTLPNTINAINKNLNEERKAFAKKTEAIALKLEKEVEGKIKTLQAQFVALKEQEKKILAQIDRDITDHVNKISIQEKVTIVKKDSSLTDASKDFTIKVIDNIRGVLQRPAP